MLFPNAMDYYPKIKFTESNKWFYNCQKINESFFKCYPYICNWSPEYYYGIVCLFYIPALDVSFVGPSNTFSCPMSWIAVMVFCHGNLSGIKTREPDYDI